MAATSTPRRDGNGFSAGLTGADARRQLRLSVGVVVVLAVAIASAALSVGHGPVAAKRDAVAVRSAVTMHADPAGATAI